MTDLKTVTFDASQWQLVPKKVTDEMAGAFMNGGEYPGRLKWKAWGNGSEEWYGDRERFDIDYSAMLAAAPTPAAQSAGQEAVSACSVCYGTGFDVNGKPCAFPHVPLRTAYTNAVPVNGGERDLINAALAWADSKPDSMQACAALAKAASAFRGERAADAQQVGGGELLAAWNKMIDVSAVGVCEDGKHLLVPEAALVEMGDAIEAQQVGSTREDSPTHMGEPVYSKPVVDAIALAKAALALVDDYHDKPTADTRKALRVHLTEKFGELLFKTQAAGSQA
ncbi:hypothetical protein [Pandoraea apista]|uniref:hypothetical protein n=1 Tax=Pandoraea apista TaxID=93218 RepID=UPI000D1BA0EA|nr:hypothetical protein [Pandoraea apista]PTE02678.1 hypothetical protein C7830_00170 [Pandoraea apista]RRJ27547.1 hypothetical protein EIB05_21545 [Pandoraea apista]RRJ73162.1 hypothetical protein EIL82_22020 [Pandoraea apista]RSD06473.1 hypothetical protein EJB12_21610 [Pandoraea apista]RSD11284.1 hypothetical protein EIZ52_21535 [Pandoraea apista]